MNNSSLVKLVCAAALTLLFSLSLQAQQGEPIGLMLSTTGVVSAEDLDGNVRRLQRRSPVFEGDTLITANRARAQVRFNDRGLIALQPNTSFFIEEHKFEGQEDGTESAIYSLLRGGLQAITGLIGYSNREKYQVSTPLATIGLRGTHWAVTFCTTACDGNPPGLYGGVADGGIDVCNGGGCTAVGANTYFYTPDANTAAETLLAPPSVVFAATPADEEGEEEEAEEIAEETTAEPEGGTETEAVEEPAADTVTDVATFVERSVEDAGTTLAAIVDTPVEERVLVAEVDEIVADRNEEVVTEVITEATRTDPAPVGSVVALATARGVGTGNTQTAGLNILINPTGTDVVPRAGFLDAATGVLDASTGVAETTTALAAFDFDLALAGCDPCLYATAGLQGTSATLDEVVEVTVDGVNVFMGRWTGDALLLNSGVDLNALQNHHYAIALVDEGFAFSSAIPSVDILDSNAIGVFSLIDGTSPTDANGEVGTLNRAELVMDFYQQIVTNMELDISFADDRAVFAQLTSPFSFAEGSVGALFAPLNGNCSGGSCGEFTEIFGDTSLSFIGSSAENILGAYSLDTEALDMSVFGTYLLGLDFTFDPLIVSNPVTTSANDGYAVMSFTSVIEIDTEQAVWPATGFIPDGEEGIDLQLTNVYDTANVFTGYEYSSEGCDPCEFNLASGRLEERGTVEVLGTELSFGTWANADFNITDTGEGLGMIDIDVLHFIYSPTDLLDSPDFFAAETPSIVTFGYLGGPSPSDETGTLGTVNYIDVVMDLYYQTLNTFDINLEIAGRLYDAGLIDIADLAGFFTDSFFGGYGVGLTGTCTNADCAEGLQLSGYATLGVAAVDSNAAEVGLVGGFALATFAAENAGQVSGEVLNNGLFGLQHTATGAFVLQQDATEDHPDYVIDPQFIATEGIAAVSVTGTQDGEFAPLGTTQDSSAADIGLISVDDADNVLVSFVDTDLDADEGGGSFIVLEGVLEEFEEIDSFIAANLVSDESGQLSTSPDFNVTLGRWNALDKQLIIDDEPIDTTFDAHFAYSDSPTDVGAFIADHPFDLSAPLLKYSLTGATAPTDESGNLGELLNTYLEIDLLQQLVSDFSLSLEIGERDIDAWLYKPVTLVDLDNEIKIKGECIGGDCTAEGTDLLGNFSFGLVGAEAEGAIGNFGLFANYGEYPIDDETLLSDITANGVFVLARDSVEENPYWFEGAPAQTQSEAGDALAFAGHIAEDGLLQSEQGAFVSLTSQREGIEQFFTLLDEIPAVYSFDVVDEYDQVFFSINPDFGALLLDKDLYEFSDALVVWGRWFAPDGYNISSEGEDFVTGTDAHFVWASTSADPGSLEIDSASIAHYSFAGGTSPTDEFGNVGEVHDVFLDLDFFQQAITDFGMDIEIAERFYSARLAHSESTYFLDDDDETELDLVGICTGIECGEGVRLEGETSLVFVGDSAAVDPFEQMAGVIGSYALATAEVSEGFGDIFDQIEYEEFNVVTETLPGDVVFDGPYVSASGTYFLLGEESDNPFYVSYLSEVPPSETLADTGIVAFATVEVDSFSGSFYSHEGIFDAEEDSIGLSQINGIDNVLSSFAFTDEDEYGDLVEIEFDILEGVLAESGGMSEFLATNGFTGTDFGVNWGRWFADAEATETSFESSPEDIETLPYHHYVYTDVVNGIFPSFENPTQATYNYVGGTSPTDEFGRTGVMSAFMRLDLYTQTLEHFRLSIKIGDRNYFAAYRGSGGYELGMDLEELLNESIDLRGVCTGGDCDYHDYSGGYLDTRLTGSASLAPFGPAGEGFLGAFELSQYDNESEYNSNINLAVVGTFVLAQGEAEDHIGWQQDPVGVAAAAPAVAAISGTLLHTESIPTTFHPFAGTVNPADGGAFTSIAIEEQAHIVDSINDLSGDCDICSFEVQEAVVIDVGQESFDYQYFTGELAEVSWATWLNRETANNEWLFEDNDQTLPLESSRLLSTIYADNLTQTDLTTLNPLTGYESSASYSYAGGPAPVATGPAERTPDLYRGRFSYVNLDIDFASQLLKDFDARMYFGDSGDDAYRSVYLAQDRLDFVTLTPTMEIDLTGYCSGAGCGSNGYDSLAGEVSLALVGDSAEQIIGGLAAWSDGDYYDIGTYGVDAGFILEQDHEGWVEASGLAVDVPTLATFAPIYFDSEISVASYVPILGIDSGLTTVEIDTTDYIGHFSLGEPVQFFTNYSDGTFEFGLEEGFIDSYGQVIRRFNRIGFDEDDNNTEPLFVATWGLWDSQSYVENLVAEGLVSPGTPINYLPFVVSRDYTQVFLEGLTPVTGGTGTTASYLFAGGAPTVNLDGLGYYGDGGEVNKISMQFDLSNQTIQQFSISATDPDDYTFEAEMTAATDLGGTFSIELSGNCLECGTSYQNLAVTGRTWLGFLGENAEGAAGSFGLGVTDTGSLMNSNSAVITGAYVLEQNDHWVDLPDTTDAENGGVVVFAAIEDVAVEGVSFGYYLDGTDTAALTNVESFDHIHRNAVAGIGVTDNVNCGDCSWDLSQGELSNYDNTLDDSFGSDFPEAYWGRWMTQDNITVDGSEIELTDFQHWAYSPDSSDYSDSVWSTDVLGEYSFADGTAPTDSWGNQGYIDDIYMKLNFQSQTVIQFDLDATVGGFAYATSMSGSTALDATDPFANIALSGTATTSGNSPSTYNAMGNSSVFMIGVDADAAIGSFDLNAVGADHTVNGAFLLEQTSLIAIPAP